jgi:galactose mutarotase-like enzyme
MAPITTHFDGPVRLVRLENDHLHVDVAPEIGGRITSLYHKGLAREFLWRNPAVPLRPSAPGDPYDPVFYGGVDEVIPGDMPEQIGGLDNPDHGELWTLPLADRVEADALVLEGSLPRWGLHYRRRMRLHPGSPRLDVDYRIENRSGAQRVFLWKLHAALAVAPGDRIDCPAAEAAVADAQWSRWGDSPPFPWPIVQGQDASRIPPADGTTDFLFLYHFEEGRAALVSAGSRITITFDLQVFPYLCYFASYGGMDGLYTAVLEPCTAMPFSVNEAARLGQCSLLEPGQSIETRISYFVEKV